MYRELWMGTELTTPLVPTFYLMQTSSVFRVKLLLYLNYFNSISTTAHDSVNAWFFYHFTAAANLTDSFFTVKQLYSDFGSKAQ